jgi:mono/diheme cytochrome c family protein/glucose/arabinose dehydrogenase
MKFLSFTFFNIFLFASFLIAQEGDKKEKNLSLLDSLNWREWSPGVVPLYTPEESLSKFKVAPGFKVELVASEPLVKDPVFVNWDDQGRMWVGEFRTYMKDLDGTGENERSSRVMVLEDTDRDGRMDKSTAFLDDMINVRSVAFVEGGVLVVESGSIWFCQDLDGDLRCDQKSKLMDFATSAFDNIEHAENGLSFALDNWMYNSKSSRKISWNSGKLIEAPASRRGQWGMATDAYGKLFYNSNSVWFLGDWGIYDHAWPMKKKTIGSPTKEVFAIRPNTALNRNYKPGSLREDGRVARVTTISGLAVHSHGAFGDDWEGAVFSMSPGTNTVGAFIPAKPFPYTEGYQHQTYADPIWEKREFLSSTDERFRPVNGTIGPDGCLYVVDFHRGVIQHKRFLTSYLRRQSEERELDKHIGHGRIYRIVPEDQKTHPSPENLVSGLSHPYLWWRLRSQKRIVEGDRQDLAPTVKELARNRKASPFARVHAIWTLVGLKKLDAITTNLALKDSNWFVAMTGLRTAGDTMEYGGVFPQVNLADAQKISQSEDFPHALVSYASKVVESGYPKRMVANYVDKPAEWVKRDKALYTSYKKGRDLYGNSCGACHQAHGKGLANMAPTLAKSDWVNGSLSRLIGVAVHGLSGPIKVNGKLAENIPPIMPPHGYMKDEELADVLTYVKNAWGNRSGSVSAQEIASYRLSTKRLLPWTEEEFSDLK